jgi:hypothetical protein
MKNNQNNLMKDLGIVVLSIVIAIILAKTGALKNLLTSVQEMRIIGSFIAGVFFVSIFTVAPSAVVLTQIAEANSIFTVAFFGGLGALVGDLIIFRFIKNNLSKSLFDFLKSSKENRLHSLFKFKFWRMLGPFIGALIIISPLPDELGLMIMGFSKVRTPVFIPLSFFLNFLGILAIGYIWGR